MGSDEEKALVKALKSSFPQSELTLCTRHLSENVSRHIRSKVVQTTNFQNKLYQICLRKWSDRGRHTVDFTEKVTEVERKYEDLIGSYLTEKIIPTIKEYVYRARKTDSRIPLQWKNN